MAGTWVHAVPYTNGSGTTATALAGFDLVIGSVGGGASWGGSSPKLRFDVNDNLSWTGTSTTINTWLHGRTAMAFGLIVNDARASLKTWGEITATGSFGSSAHNSFRHTVSSAGVAIWAMNQFPGGVGTPIDMVTSSAGEVAANTDTYLLGVFDSGNATAADRARLYKWGVRVTPAVYVDPGSGYTLTFANAGAKLSNGGDTANGQTIDGSIAWHEIATDIPDDAEIADRADQLAIDDDAEPTTSVEATGTGGSSSAVQATAATGKATATATGATSQAAQLTSATGKATATAFGATGQPAQLTAGKGVSVGTATGATSNAAQATAGAGASTATGKGGSVAAAQVTGGKGIGNEGTGDGATVGAAQETGGSRCRRGGRLRRFRCCSPGHERLQSGG